MTQDSEAYDRLTRFIKNDMRMSHVYQPVMIRELLRHKGSASVSEVARALLSEDCSQIEYYEQITKNMVGRVLTENRGITEKDGNTYRLKNFPQLTPRESDELIRLCDAKIAEYLAKRSDPWSHRRKSLGYVPGTQRYEVLKRAKYRCELCGVSAEFKALEVDHIVPRNHGGSDDESNLQALCYSCNATKRDRDDTDFRGMSLRYDDREASCAFCIVDQSRLVAENELCFAILDAHPVSAYHTLVLPKRHVANFFELYQPELNAIHSLLHQTETEIRSADQEVTGFNVGINVGQDAGQTVFHSHVHLIPRRHGDVQNARGAAYGA
jgi:ATP adenylyltransferase